MKISENMIVTDTRPGENWCFDKILSDNTGIQWNVTDGGLQYKLGGLREKVKRYVNLISFPFELFLKRKKIKNIIAWQQYYGLFYAFYCMVFHVKKRNYCMVMTFIYREREGIIGKIQRFVVGKIVNSKYLDNIMVYSKNEKEYYQKIFGIEEGKIVSARLGLEDLTKGIVPLQGEVYLLSAGRSNRDYDFLIHALKGKDYPVKIVCDAMKKGNEENIQIYDDVYYEKFFQMIADCFCIIITLKDNDISSGQLVILQAMQFSKPVIVTDSKTVRDYISDGAEGFIIPKDEKALCEKIDLLLHDRELYIKMSLTARKSYEERFSMKALGKQVSDCFKKNGQEKR